MCSTEPRSHSTRPTSRRRSPPRSSRQRANACGTRYTPLRSTPPRCRSAARPQPGGEPAAAAAMVSALDPSFRTQELAYVIEQIAANVDYAAAAGRRSWVRPAARASAIGIHGAAQLRKGAGARPRPAELLMASQQPARRHRPRAGGTRRRPDVRAARASGSFSGRWRCCARTRSAPGRPWLARSQAPHSVSSSAERSWR